MTEDLTDSELEAYLDEALDPDHAMLLEKQLREQPDLIGKLSQINARRDAGLHTLGEIWRRYEIGVPGRDELIAYMDGKCDTTMGDYIRFRVETLKCPFTLANLQDLENERAEESEEGRTRRERYFQLNKRLADDCED